MHSDSRQPVTSTAAPALLRQVQPGAHFEKDLGLDSLDVVELVSTRCALSMRLPMSMSPRDTPPPPLRPCLLYSSLADRGASHGPACQVMAFEEEFSIEIPDADADKIFSVDDAVNYIASHPMAK